MLETSMFFFGLSFLAKGLDRTLLVGLGLLSLVAERLL